MKLRRSPEDFQVDELTDFSCSGGSFALYVLEKRSLGTLEAVAAIARKWGLPRNAVGFGGLKDKHAHTRQHLTIARGPSRSLRQEHFSLTYVGQAQRAFHASDIRGNRFDITLRDLSPEQAAARQAALESLARFGAPNYFDDQRFGSLGESGRFVAEAWVRGQYEETIWLAVADANEHDAPDERRWKEALRGDWSKPAARNEALRALGRRELAEHLNHRPSDFRGAIARLPIDARSLYLAAFQSWVWNRMLAELLQKELPEENRQPLVLKPGPVWTYRGLTDAQLEALNLSLPLPSARAKPECQAHADLVEAALAPLQLTLRELRVKYPRDSFFSKGLRPALLFPAGMAGEIADDEIYPDRKKLTLRFDLPRGSYATMIVKRLESASMMT